MNNTLATIGIHFPSTASGPSPLARSWESIGTIPFRRVARPPSPRSGSTSWSAGKAERTARDRFPNRRRDVGQWMQRRNEHLDISLALVPRRLEQRGMFRRVQDLRAVTGHNHLMRSSELATALRARADAFARFDEWALLHPATLTPRRLLLQSALSTNSCRLPRANVGSTRRASLVCMTPSAVFHDDRARSRHPRHRRRPRFTPRRLCNYRRHCQCDLGGTASDTLMSTSPSRSMRTSWTRSCEVSDSTCDQRCQIRWSSFTRHACCLSTLPDGVRIDVIFALLPVRG